MGMKLAVYVLGISLFLVLVRGQLCSDFEPQCDAPCMIEPTDIETEEFQTFYIYLAPGLIYDIALTAVYEGDNDPNRNTDVDVYLDDAFVNALPDHYTNQFASDEYGDDYLIADLTEETEGLCLAVAIYGYVGGRYQATFELSEDSVPVGQTPPVARAVQPRSFTCDTVDSPSTFRMGMSVVEEYIPYICTSAQIASFLIPAASLLNAPCEKWKSIKGITEFLSGQVEDQSKSVAMVNCWEEPIVGSGSINPVTAFSLAANTSGIAVKMEDTGTPVLTQGIIKYNGNAEDSLCTSSTWFAAVYKSGEQTDVYDAQTKYLVDEILGENVDEAEFVTLDATEDPSLGLRSYWRNKEGILLTQGVQGPLTEDWKVRFCEISIATSASIANTLSVFVISAILLMTAFVSF